MTDQKPAKKETSDEDKPVIKKRDNYYNFNPGTIGLGIYEKIR